MIRDIDICFTSAQKVSAQSYEHNGTFRRVIVEIDSLTLRIAPDDAQRLRDALDRVLSDQPMEAA